MLPSGIANFTGDTVKQAAKLAEDISNPAGLPSPVKASPLKYDFTGYKYRIQQFKMSELGDISALEKIMSKSIGNGGVVVIGKKEFLFMETIIILLEYFEKDSD